MMEINFDLRIPYFRIFCRQNVIQDTTRMSENNIN